MKTAESNISTLVSTAAERDAGAIAVQYGSSKHTYRELDRLVTQFTGALLSSGHRKGDRVAVYTHKCMDAIVAIFGAARAGCIFVPINPLLKPHQLLHILKDCSPRSIVTTEGTADDLQQELDNLPQLDSTILVDSNRTQRTYKHKKTVSWPEFVNRPSASTTPVCRESDRAAILYTSGSTGKPKGVLLAHSNLTVGASSVATYLDNRCDDRILAVLPLSFDVGLSQLTTAFHVGARAVLHNYLLPQEVIRSIREDTITGITGVPSLWIQLMTQDWPEGCGDSLRYFANTGGIIPDPTLGKLRKTFSSAKPYLMYGFTEAFRSTYLPPSEIDNRPGSIGKAIPNAEICIADADGRPAGPGEQGELVHRGPLVALGYWNDPEATAKKFRPISELLPTAPKNEVAAWSGDTVIRDGDGFIYFVGRDDAMIKTSGYRVSPNEIEQVVAQTNLTRDCVAFGVPHKILDQAIVLVAVPRDVEEEPTDELQNDLRKALPGYMLPKLIVWLDALPLNANGKPDRPGLASRYSAYFKQENAT